MIVEPGEHVLEDGRRLEADHVGLDDRWQEVSFDADFDSVPIVLSQVQSYNGTDPVVTRHKSISAWGFSRRLQEAEIRGRHTQETVGWIAIEPGIGQTGDQRFEVDTVPERVNHNWHRLRFDQRFARAPAFLARIQTFHGSNTANLRYRYLTDNGVEIFVDEEKSRDPETRHVNREVVGFIASEAGVIRERSCQGSSHA